jgi:hypothetical protein
MCRRYRVGCAGEWYPHPIQKTVERGIRSMSRFARQDRGKAKSKVRRTEDRRARVLRQESSDTCSLLVQLRDLGHNGDDLVLCKIVQGFSKSVKLY